MSAFLASLAYAGKGAHEGRAEIPLWSSTPVLVECDVTADGDELAPETERLIAHIETALPTLWRAIEPALLEAANAKEAWKLLSRLESLAVLVKEGTPQWSLAATFGGKRAGMIYIVEIENDVVVGSFGGD